MDIGSAVSRRHWSQTEIHAILAGENQTFSDLEQLVLRLAEAMTATPVDVSDELLSALRAHFSEDQIIELCAVIAHENYRARMYHALGIESDNFIL
jgi:alkylhydroperoxidase family enzyme